jgi:GH25 family lysozyme M1 (1,4-beta-N-acetylmuramidase)
VITGIIDVDHTASTPEQIAAAHAQGVLAVIAKCTQGKDYVDPAFAAWRDRVRKVDGLLFGEYHFGSNSCPGNVQADWFLAHAAPDSLMILDWEWNPDHVGGDMSLANAELFVQRIYQVTDRWPVVYCARAFVVHDKIPEQSSPLANCPLWVVHYADPPPHLPIAPWRRADLVQYTDVKYGPHDTRTYPRITPGLGRKADRSYFDGDAVALREWWANAGRERGPQCSTPGGP